MSGQYVEMNRSAVRLCFDCDGLSKRLPPGADGYADWRCVRCGGGSVVESDPAWYRIVDPEMVIDCPLCDGMVASLTSHDAMGLAVKDSMECTRCGWLVTFDENEDWDFIGAREDLTVEEQDAIIVALFAWIEDLPERMAI